MWFGRKMPTFQRNLGASTFRQVFSLENGGSGGASQKSRILLFTVDFLKFLVASKVSFHT
jgi:hypothetical protein